jgi:hypothetical protein
VDEALGPYTTVLVALLKAPRDLELARDAHWYRIPVRRLPERAAAAPLVAFYQTSAFGEERWAIRYFAAVERWTQARRVDLLPDEPDHPRAQEAYYQLWLGPLQSLPQPIPSLRWRRITFIVTHWERLLAAANVEELLHGSRWDEALWRSMRKLNLLAEHVLHEVRGWFGVQG